MAPYLQSTPEGTLLRLKVQPRASRNEIAGIAADELRVRVTAPPVDSAANEALIEFLASELQCRRGDLSIVRGSTSRHKVLLVRQPASVVASRLPS